MAFLDSFGAAHRALLEESAQTVRLGRGQYLIRRGEPGGDVYVLRKGLLEAVDARSTPEIILNTLPEGAVVGEMAFVDGSPRSVDVRAGSEATVLRWTRDALRELMIRHPDLAASFYENVARLASGRVRFLTEGAVTGAFGRDASTVADATEVRAWVATIADRVKLSLPPVENALRREGDDESAILKVREVLDLLQADVDQLFDAIADPAARRFAAEQLGRELHAYLVRSALAERCLRPSDGAAATGDVLAHVLVDVPGGDGRLGELIDRWLLDRPTFRALRGMRDAMAESVAIALPRNRNRRVLVVSAGTGSFVASLQRRLVAPTVITILDQSREALAVVEDGDRYTNVEVNLVEEDLGRFLAGRTANLPRQDAVVLQGLLEYLPERLAVALLRVARALLTDDGVVAVATLGPSPDRTLLDRLLAWPTLRRSGPALEGLTAAAGLLVIQRPPVPDPGRILLLRQALS